MAHIFDIMSTVSRQINDLEYHNGNEKPNVPDFLVIEANRAIDNIEGIRLKEDKPISLDHCIGSYAGYPATYIYTCIGDNISEPIVDTFAISAEGKDRKDRAVTVCNNAIGIIVPKILFENDTDIEYIGILLRKLYFAILDLDTEMHYAADPAIIKLCKSKKVRIPTYDVEMAICAVCCIYVTLSSWFNKDTIEKSFEDYTLDSFTDKEIPVEFKNKIKTIMTRHCASTKSIRDAIETGKLLKIFFLE